MTSLEKQYQLSICIPTFDNADVLIENTLAIISEIQNVDFTCEIIIGLNYSNDIDVAKVKNLESKIVKVYAHHSNLGFAKNLFFTMNRAAGRYILIMGDDDFFQPGLLNELSSYITAPKGITGIGFLPIKGTKFKKDDIYVQTYMRSASVMGIIFEKCFADFDGIKIERSIYPQIELAMQILMNYGFTSFHLTKEIIMGEGLPVELRFSDKMGRPSDYGVIERLEILWRCRNRGLPLLQFFRCIFSLIEWVEDVSQSLKSHNVDFNRKFCRSIMFNKFGLMLFYPAVLLKSILKMRRYSCLTGLAF